MSDTEISISTGETVEITYSISSTGELDEIIDIDTENKEFEDYDFKNIKKFTWTPTDDDVGTHEFTVNGEEISIEVNEIPDSVVSRPDDDTDSTTNDERGLLIEVSEQWSRIGVEISNITDSNQTGVVVRDHDDGSLMGYVEFDDKGPGDTVAVDLDKDLEAGENASDNDSRNGRHNNSRLSRQPRLPVCQRGWKFVYCERILNW